MRTGLIVGVAVLALAGCHTLSGRDRIVKRAPDCPDQRVQIYFEPNSSVVTDEGRAVLVQAAKAAQGCTVKSVHVLGLADAAGAPDANLELSRRRADSVTAALAAAGLPPAEFKVAAAGEAGATNAKGDPRLLRRRTDVVLHLSPR